MAPTESRQRGKKPTPGGQLLRDLSPSTRDTPPYDRKSQVESHKDEAQNHETNRSYVDIDQSEKETDGRENGEHRSLLSGNRTPQGELLVLLYARTIHDQHASMSSDSTLALPQHRGLCVALHRIEPLEVQPFPAVTLSAAMESYPLHGG